MPMHTKFANGSFFEFDYLKAEAQTHSWFPPGTHSTKIRILWPGTIVEAEDAEFTLLSTFHKVPDTHAPFSNIDPKYPV